MLTKRYVCHAIFPRMNEINAHEHRLNLSEVLEWMVADGLVTPEVAEALKVERRMHSARVHPVSYTHLTLPTILLV